MTKKVNKWTKSHSLIFLCFWVIRPWRTRFSTGFWWFYNPFPRYGSLKMQNRPKLTVNGPKMKVWFFFTFRVIWLWGIRIWKRFWWFKYLFSRYGPLKMQKKAKNSPKMTKNWNFGFKTFWLFRLRRTRILNLIEF